MKERSVADVLADLATERRILDGEIKRQSFYCTRLNRVIAPAECHDCFASLPYTERLMRWNENRMLCIQVHGREIYETKRQRDVKPSVLPSPARSSLVPASDDRKEHLDYSIEDYLSRGLLEFLLDLDSMTERFQTWQESLPEAARRRVHQSLELQEMILWFAERLADFRLSLLGIGRMNKEDKKTKEERCGVKNSQSIFSG
ncbi:hypothetical protein JXM67_15465 [candidate division WOR-3 bacterium]|nr:hypothetical protein [candidate division WOR-3 bacterium]